MTQRAPWYSQNAGTTASPLGTAMRPPNRDQRETERHSCLDGHCAELLKVPLREPFADKDRDQCT